MTDRPARMNKSFSGSLLMSTRRFLRLSGLCALTALILRIIMFAEVMKTDSFVCAPSAITDMATYQTLSDQILHGELPPEFEYQPFYYAVFLPLAKLIFQSDFVSIGLSQSICAALIVWFAGLSAALLHSRAAGLMTALLCTFSQLLFFYVPYALIEIQQCLWFTLLLYLLLRYSGTGKMKFATASGLILSFAILSRGNAWCFLPVMLYAFHRVSVKYHTPWKKRVITLAVFAVAVILPQMPFAVYNTIQTGSLSGPSTAGPAVLTIGNNPEAAPGSLVIPYPPTYEEWMNHQETCSIPQRILQWFCEEPAAFLIHQAEKVLLFFDRTELYNNVNPEYNAVSSRIFHTCGIIPTGILIAFCAAGFVLFLMRRRHHTGEQILHAMICLYAPATAAFYILARFRVPAIGLFCVGGGIFTASVFQLRKFDVRTVLRRILLPVLAGVLAVNFFFGIYRPIYESPLMRKARPHGVRLLTEEGTALIHDNSPFYNNSWLSCPITPATEVVKRFDTSMIPGAETYQNAVLQLTFVCAKSYNFLVQCNGKTFPVVIDAPRTLTSGEVATINAEIGPMEVPADFIFRLTFPGASSQNDLPQLAVDPYRNYERTLINGETLGAEAVITLKLQKE